MDLRSKWKLIYYENTEGTCYIENFISRRDNREKSKVYAFIAQLEERGPNLPRPYADILRDGIHELRIKLSGEQERMLYFFLFGNYIVATHMITKKTARVPDREIDFAIQCRNDFLKKYHNRNQLETALQKGECKCLNA